MAPEFILLIFSILPFEAESKQHFIYKSKQSTYIPINFGSIYNIGSKHAQEVEPSSNGETNFIFKNEFLHMIEQTFSEVHQGMIKQSRAKMVTQQIQTKITTHSARESAIKDGPKGLDGTSNGQSSFDSALQIDDHYHLIVRRDSSNSCYSYGTCKSNENYTFRVCYCDADCTYYKDCCLDTKRSGISTTEPEKFQYTECVNIDIPRKYGGGFNRGFYMVTKCPFVDTTCDQNGTDIPVTDNNGISYKNEQCALCHGIKHYRYWSIAFYLDSCTTFNYTSLRSNKLSDRIETLKQLKCSMYFIPPTDLHEHKTAIPRSCITLVKKFYTENTTLCDNFANPVFLEDIHKTFIKNIYCLNVSEHIGYISCIRSTNVYESLIEDIIPNTDYGRMPMTVMFQFKPKDNDGKYSCGISLLLNSNQALTACSDEKCNSSIDSEVCSEESVQNFALRFNITLKSYNVHYVTAFERALLMYFLSLPIDSYSIKLMGIHGMISCSEKIQLNEPNGCCVARNVQIHAVVGRKMKQEETVQLSSSIQNMKFVYTERDYDTINARYTTVENILHGDNTSCELDGLNNIRTFLNLPLLKWLSAVIVFDRAPVMNYTVVPKLSKINASVHLKPELYMPDTQLFNSMFNMTVNHWVIMFSDKTDNTMMTMSSNSTFIHTVITYSTMAISCAALLLTLGLYVYFEMYTLFADHICINMMSVLFLANVLFMTGIGATDYEALCTIIGIVLHYSWLCVFSWVIIFSGMVILMMVRLGRNESYYPEMELSKTSTSLLGYGIPLLLVIPSVVLSRFQIDSFEIRYNIGICFLTGFPANIIFFSGPLLLSVMINCILLLVGFKEFSKYSCRLTTTQTTVISRYIAPYIRLCFLSLIFWTFGILAQLFHNDVLAFLFIIFCGSQGSIASLCFLTSTRIRRNIRICRKKKYSSRSTVSGKTEDIELKE